MLKNKTKDLNIELQLFSIKNIKAKFKDNGMDYAAQNIYPIYVVFVLGALFVCYLYKLNLLYTAIVTLTAFFAAPIVLVSNMKKKTEKKKFNDANAYMKQLIEGVTDYKKIKPVMANISDLFEEGDMKKTLTAASDIMNNTRNVKLARGEALLYIEERYGCEHMKIIHDFCIKLEDNGGDFSIELNMLDEFREEWMNQISKHQKNLEYAMRVANMAYGLMIGVLLLAQYLLDNIEMITIHSNPMAQLANFLFLIGFLVFLLFTENKTCAPMLKDEEHMTVEEIEEKQEYIANYKKSSLNKTSMRNGIICFLAMLLAAIFTQSLAFVIIGVVLSAFFFYMPLYLLKLYKNQLRKEIIICFPKWLFDLCLYMQKDTITRAVENSLQTAPPIMRKELINMMEEIRKNPGSDEAYLNFMKSYELNEIKDSMQMLLSIRKGYITRKEYQMQNLVNYNMKIITKSNELKLEDENALNMTFCLIPSVPAIFVGLCYCICIFISSFEFGINLINTI